MSDFSPVVDRLRERILQFYVDTGDHLDGAAGRNTLETNSGLVERRAAPLIGLLGMQAVHSLEGKRLVDLGCGFGALACYFAFRGASVVAVDPNRARLEVGRDVAADFGLDITFMGGYMQRIALDSEAFDVAIQNNSFCYIVPRDERAVSLRETFRVLRRGGVLAARNPNRWHPWDPFTGYPCLHLATPSTAVRLASRLNRKRSLVRLTSPYEARRELRLAGFEDVHHAALARHRGPTALKLVAKYHHLCARRPP